MDKLLISSLSHTPAISEHLSQMRTSTQSASQSAHSARELLPHSATLCARRMQRSEALLRLFRLSLADMLSVLSAFQAALQAVATHPARTKPRWDRLPDEWWRTRAARTASLAGHVGEAVERLESRAQARADTYVEAVDTIRDGVREMCERWDAVVGYVGEWAPVAKAVADGLGEEGSLLSV